MDESERFKEQAGMVKALTKAVGAPDPELLLSIIRAARPGLTSGLAGCFGELLRDAKKYCDQSKLEELFARRRPSPNGKTPPAKQPAPSTNGHCQGVACGG